ncbi:anti-sigma factor [Aurantibacillus circumpalustris]|uniref:anti-sigma factor n=1 Tax=Aurantibacillus circumpalustris TaxID=3036359 RepID=UPI00295BEF6C|nr:anti-sigma factor [Aurantibacillus circumpalustris]
MNSKEVISSGLLESYVLGISTKEETALINTLCKENSELLKEIESIEETLIDFSSKLSPPINTDLKEKISTQLNFIAEDSPIAKVISIKNETEGRLSIYKLGIAASLLLFLTSLMYNVQLNHKLSKVNLELAQLNETKSYLADELKIQQASLKSMDTELEILSNPKVKTIALNGMNSLDKKTAMIHMNMETHDVYFNASSLPNSPTDKQYQLWAIVDGKPIDAGMIDMHSTASVFQKMKSVSGAQAFAVTIENMGGSPVPTMKTMCLLGNV